MDVENPKNLPLSKAYEFGIRHGLEAEVSAIRSMEIEWDLSYTSSVRCGYILTLFESKGLLRSFIEERWPIGATPFGVARQARYTRLKQRYEDYLAGQEPEPCDGEDDGEGEQGFVKEADLRNVLAANLASIEPGMKLYEDGERSGVEFPIDGGRIDILAVDREGGPVVIELKLSRGRNKVLGQLLFYMGWVDEHLGRGPCRGIIVAREIPDDLRLAARRVQGVGLRTYRLSISTEQA